MFIYLFIHLFNKVLNTYLSVVISALEYFYDLKAQWLCDRDKSQTDNIYWTILHRLKHIFHCI